MVGSTLITPVLITRAQAQARRFADALVGMGVPVGAIICDPVIQITYAQTPPDISRFDGAICTSVHGVPAQGPDRGPNWGMAMYCVGPTTAQAARDAGFQVQHMAPTAAGLRAHLERAKLANLVYLRGQHVSDDMADLAHNIVTYDQSARGLAKQTITRLTTAGTYIAPLFSARSARLALGQLAGVGSPHFVAISAAVGQVASDHGHPVTIAAQPTGDAMATAVVRQWQSDPY